MAEVRLYRDHLERVVRAIDALRNGAATAVVFGTSYTSADLDAKLYPLHDLLSVKAAIEAIEQGHQSFSIGDRTFTKANLQDLYARRDALERQVTVAARGGRRTRLAVPLG